MVSLCWCWVSTPELFTTHYLMRFLPWFPAFCLLSFSMLQPVVQHDTLVCTSISIWAYSYSVSITQPLQGQCCVGLPFTYLCVKKTVKHLYHLEAMTLFIAAITNQRLRTRCNWLISHLGVLLAFMWCSSQPVYTQTHTYRQGCVSWRPPHCSLSISQCERHIDLFIYSCDLWTEGSKQ